MATDSRGELSTKDIEKFYTFGHSLIENSRKLILGYWENQSFDVELKGDNSPVTQADLEAEELLRELIAKEFPSHGVIGEEHELTQPDSEFQWTIDPIDGTQNFAAGIPTFGTMLSLRFRNKPIIAYLDHPALGLLCAGSFGGGVSYNGKPISIKDSPITTLSGEEIINISTPAMFGRTGERALLEKFVGSHNITRSYFDCFGHTMSAIGSLDATVEFNVRIWDASPTELLVEEAGGSFVYVRDMPSLGTNYKNFLSAIFGKPSVVNALLPKFSK